MAKGSDFEREICEDLSNWWSKGIEGSPRKDVFWRTSGSGGRFTSSKKNIENSAGDVCALAEIGFPLVKFFHIEIKRGYTTGKTIHKKKIKNLISGKLKDSDKVEKIYKLIQSVRLKQSNTISITDFIDKLKGEPLLNEWWEKSELERKKSGQYCSIIIFRRDRREKCIAINSYFFSKFEGIQGFYKKDFIEVVYNGLANMCIVRFDEFLDWLKPRAIKKLLEECQSKECVDIPKKEPKIFKKRKLSICAD